MKLKRIISAILAAVTLALALSVTVSADSIYDTAKNVGSGKKVSKTLGTGKTMDYKFTAQEKGTAEVKVTAKVFMFYFNVFDEDGNDVEYEYKIAMGDKDPSSKRGFWWDRDADTFKGTFSFDVKANKTYYVQLKRYSYSYDGETGEFSASFKYPSETVEKAPLMSVTLKKGDTLQLNANGDGAKWSTSKKAVATVSDKGLVKAVKAGKAVITLKCGSKSQEIEIVVE